jgi:predicted YcjX-like family ATPase
MYESIREMDDDVPAIAQHTGISEARIARIKRHIFSDFHQLDDGVRRFDADPLIVNAWQRLRRGRQTLQDVQLLQHELFEARFEGICNTTYRIAHEATNRSGRPSGLE